MTLWLLTFAVVGFVVIRWSNARAQPRHELGVLEGQLAECPESPNCVSTQSGDADQRMIAMPWSGSAEAAIKRIESIIESMPRARIVTSTGDYLHAEFGSLLFGFIDDVEFLVDETGEVIHFRSASRVGYSDLGVNKRRMEEIVRRFANERERSTTDTKLPE